MSERIYEWNGHTHTIRRPDWTDEEVAIRVRMLMRSDLDHELICVTARDRIVALAMEKEELKAALRGCLHVLEKGLEVRMVDQWPALREIVPDTIKATKDVLAKP